MSTEGKTKLVISGTENFVTKSKILNVDNGFKPITPDDLVGVKTVKADSQKYEGLLKEYKENSPNANTQGVLFVKDGVLHGNPGTQSESGEAKAGDLDVLFIGAVTGNSDEVTVHFNDPNTRKNYGPISANRVNPGGGQTSPKKININGGAPLVIVLNKANHGPLEVAETTVTAQVPILENGTLLVSFDTKKLPNPEVTVKENKIIVNRVTYEFYDINNSPLSDAQTEGIARQAGFEVSGEENSGEKEEQVNEEFEQIGRLKDSEDIKKVNLIKTDSPSFDENNVDENNVDFYINGTTMHGNPRKRNDELMIGSAGCDLPLGEVLNVKLVGPSTDKAEKNIVFFSTQGAKAAKNINIDAGNQNLKIEIPLEFSYKPFQEVGTKVTIANAKPLAVTFKVHEDLKKEVKGNTITIGGVPYEFDLTPEEVQQIAKKSGFEAEVSSKKENTRDIAHIADIIEQFLEQNRILPPSSEKIKMGTKKLEVNPDQIIAAATKNTGNTLINTQGGEKTTETNQKGTKIDYGFYERVQFDKFVDNTSSGHDLGNIGDLRATMAYYSFDHDNNNGGGDHQNIVSQQDQTPTITASADITIA